MSLALRSVLLTDLGLIRANNEDSAYAGSRLLVIADGVGGAPAGEDASAIVIRELAALETAELGDEPARTLLDHLMTANREIYQATLDDPLKEGMGTTMTAVLLSADADEAAEVTVAHVGDSRAYLLRDGELRRLTKDDTYVQTLIDRGVLSEDDARHHPQKSLITQSVQGLDFTTACSTVAVRPGDRFLLCSDGLSDIVTDHSIAHALQTHPEVKQAAEQLVKLALQAGAPDNVTVVVADVTTVEAGPKGARRLPGVAQLAALLGL
ncbi:MAG: serine/threonine-protein phosphatase [Hamadaea sp.]|uniref:PP2C family protein-serine/threonine phosphatase n=1 Tax=Hamadaea sp. TaxID=2024425 RepID=UPI00184F70B0|nr:protein phosphatase 2C domain-containing protein [Hamadaea sp.]NUR71877.1 serine/threonine-protein phosphatase [Hamadaea sp.]NUT19897.1 serine/threonine-protein phosphatase [Hamadaea sp.]